MRSTIDKSLARALVKKLVKARVTENAVLARSPKPRGA